MRAKNAENNYDVFVSYAHADNMPFPISKNDKGWVDMLIDNLRSFLIQKGEHINIFMDHKFSNYGILVNKIKDALNNSLILMPIISKNYLQSSYCEKERIFFREKFLSNEDYNDRIICVEKETVDNNPFKDHLRNIFWLKDFRRDVINTLCLMDFRDKETYNDRVGNLCYSLIEILQKLKY